MPVLTDRKEAPILRFWREGQMTDAQERAIAAGATTQELFLDAWHVYRKMVDNDYLFHRDAYGCLRRILEEIDRPFCFLDAACGDAGMSTVALRGTRIAHYYGID